MSTLLYHSGALGDFITTLPAIAWWRKLFPGPVTLLGKTTVGNLAVTAGYIDEVIDADSSRYLFLFNEQPATERLESFFQRFDAVLLYAGNDAPIVTNACRHFPGKLFCQPPLPEGNLHAVDYHLSLFPDSAPEPLQRIPVITVARPFPQPLPHGRPVIALHPGSGSRLKNWPFDRYLALAASLKKRNFSTVWISGPAEPVLPIPESDLHLGTCALADCVSFFHRCAWYIGNDSGMTHLAAAAGCNVTALFGPSDPVRWAPRGTGRITVIHHPLAECTPCHLQGNRDAPVCNRTCLTQITVDEILASIIC